MHYQCCLDGASNRVSIAVQIEYPFTNTNSVSIDQIVLNLTSNGCQIVFLPFPEPLCLAVCPSYSPFSEPKQTSKSFSIKDLIGDGIFWAVPRSRRTIEKRWKRKYGSPGYHVKTIVPKHTLRVCNHCGHDHEVGLLCRKYLVNLSSSWTPL